MSAVLDIWGLPGGHSIHSNLLSYCWGVCDTEFGRYSPHVSINQIAVSRKPDKHSSLLFDLCISGGSIDVMKVSLTYTDEDGYTAKGGLLFRDSVISSMSRSGNANSVERMSVSFGSFQREY